MCLLRDTVNIHQSVADSMMRATPYLPTWTLPDHPFAATSHAVTPLRQNDALFRGLVRQSLQFNAKPSPSSLSLTTPAARYPILQCLLDVLVRLLCQQLRRVLGVVEQGMHLLHVRHADLLPAHTCTGYLPLEHTPTGLPLFPRFARRQQRSAEYIKLEQPCCRRQEARTVCRQQCDPTLNLILPHALCSAVI